MVTKSQLTIPNLISAMKEAGFVTKSDLDNFPTKEDMNQSILESAQAITDGQDKIYEKLEEHDRRFDEHDKRFDNVERSQEKHSAEITFIKNDINGLKADLALTPSRSQFKKLEEKVSKLKN